MRQTSNAYLISWLALSASAASCSIEPSQSELPASSQRARLATVAAEADAGDEEDAGPPRVSVVSRSRGTPGQIAGTTSWVFPDTRNGLQPNQSWFSVAGSPDGTIYASACDHETNSALYRVRPGSNTLELIGDAKSASERADNWLPEETAEKFHVRPLWHDGRVYIATADYSNQDDAYLEHRGYHWYAYDEQRRRFLDLSPSEPAGVGAEHISMFSTALDPARGIIYGLGSPNSNLYQYDIATGLTTDLGRSPELTRPYYNPGRFLWVDHTGSVYTTVGNSGPLAADEPGAPKYVLSWVPGQGWKPRTDWPIGEMLRTGQRSLDGKRVYILDYPLRLYVFNEDDQSFTQIAQGKLTDQHVSPRTKNVRVRATQLSANERKIYFVNDSAPVNSLWEWDFASGEEPRELTTIEAIDPRLDARYNAFTGHDSWDNWGRFSVTGFGGEGFPVTPYVYLVRIDPVRVKAALGLLPGVPEVEVRRSTVRRSGDVSTELSVILELTDAAGAISHRNLTLAANQSSVALPSDLAPGTRVRVVADGDTYAVPEPRGRR
jgi:hypothetical protein